MDEINLLDLIKRRFAALLANVHPRADPKLAAEVPATLAQADSDLPAVFMRARRVLEIIVLDIYRRELPTAKPKPLADMIEALYEKQGLVSKRVAADLHYIRVNGNLIIHPQDEAVAIRPGDAEPVLLVFLSVVEWYLAVHLPERLGEAPARAPTLPPGLHAYQEALLLRLGIGDLHQVLTPLAAHLAAVRPRRGRTRSTGAASFLKKPWSAQGFPCAQLPCPVFLARLRSAADPVSVVEFSTRFARLRAAIISPAWTL